MMMIDVVSFDPRFPRTWVDVEGCLLNGLQLRQTISQNWGIPVDLLKLCQGKRYLNDTDIVDRNETVHALLGLLGGKGGFGSMLRAIGAQIEKTTNKEACRDLSGRRLRDINEEKRLKKWIAKQAEREREQAERKRLRLEQLRTPPTHTFHDPEYDKARSNITEKVHDAVSQGIQKAKQEEILGKRKAEETVTKPPKKKAYRWMDDDDSLDEEEMDTVRAHSSDNADSNQSSSMDCASLQNKDESSVESSAPSTSYTEETLHVPPENRFVDNESASDLTAGSCSKDAPANEVDRVPPVDSVNSEDRAENRNATAESSMAKKTETPEKSKARKDEQSRGDRTSSKDAKKYSIEDLDKFASVEELEALGLDELKRLLTCLEMKCGGSLTERASRLFGVKGLKQEDVPAQLLAKKKK